MPITIKKNGFKYKDPDTGDYKAIDVIAETTISEQTAAIRAAAAEQITAVQNAGAGQISDVQAAGQETIASIPQDYTALSNEVNGIKSSLDVVNDFIKVTGSIESNKYIDPDGNIATADTWSVETIEAVPGAKYKITAKAFSQRYYFAFYDANNSFISGLKRTESGSGIAYDQIAVAPNNAKYLSVSFIEAEQSGRSIEKETTDSARLDRIENSVGTIENMFVKSYNELTADNVESNKYIDPDGNVSTANGWSVESYSVNPKVEYKVTAQAFVGRYYFAYYDSNDNFISGVKSSEDGTTWINEYLTEAPSNAVVLKCACVTTELNSARVFIGDDFQPINWKEKKWVAFGDSLTEQNNRTTKHYYDYISETTGISINIMANGGSGYMREQDEGTAFYQRISSVPTDADVITIFGSFNDLGGGYNLGTATDTGTNTIGGCINTTLDNLFAAYPLAVVGVVTPTPWVGYNPTNEPNNASSYVELIMQICKMRSIPCLDLFHESLLRPWDANFRELAYSKDDGNGVHPDETGHKLIAPRFKGFLDSLLLD